MKKTKVDKVNTLIGSQSSFSPKTVKINFSKFNTRPHLRPLGARNNEGTFKNSQGFQMLKSWDDSVIYFPRRKKLKGYEKQAKR